MDLDISDITFLKWGQIFWVHQLFQNFCVIAFRNIFWVIINLNGNDYDVFGVAMTSGSMHMSFVSCSRLVLVPVIYMGARE